MFDFLNSFVPAGCTLTDTSTDRCPDTDAWSWMGTILDEDGEECGDILFVVDGGDPIITWW